MRPEISAHVQYFIDLRFFSHNNYLSGRKGKFTALIMVFLSAQIPRTHINTHSVRRAKKKHRKNRDVIESKMFYFL